MADLGKTQDEWTAVFREFGLFLKVADVVLAGADRFRYARTQIAEEYDNINTMSLWSIDGAKIGVNTDSFGILYIKLLDETPGAGQAKVEVYKDSARTSKVAEGSASDGGTITLAEVSNSGVTGSVKIGTITANKNDVRLVLLQDFLLQYQDVFANTGAGQDALGSFLSLCDSMRDSLDAEVLNAKTTVESNFIITRLREFLNSTTGFVASIEESLDDDLNITLNYTGVIADLIDCMNDETTASAQKVLKNTVSAGTVSADGDNVGDGTLTVSEVKQFVNNGTVVVKCIDETIGLEAFTVEQRVDVSNEILTAQNYMYVNKTFKSADLGFALSLARTLTETGDGSGQLSGWAITGESEDNTDDGVLYVSLTDSGGTRTVNVYKAAARAAADLVASGSRVGDGVITLAEQNASGLTGAVTVAYTTPDTDITLDLNVFKIGDEFRFDLSNDEAGVVQTLVGRLWKMELPNATSGAETISDGVVKEGLRILTTDHNA